MSHWKPVDLVQDLVNKIGGGDRIKRFLSGELVLVERSTLAVSGSSENGGISPYVSNLLNSEVFIADWREFYQQVHSMKVDPSGLVKRLPPITPGFNWGVWVPKGMMPQRAFEMCQAMFSCWKWCGNRSLDEVIDFTKEARTAQEKQYVSWCEDQVEADNELKNTLALQVAERRTNTLTLTEVELLRQWFYWKSGGKHLDISNWTLCPASRYSDGRVPCVYSYRSGHYGELRVSGCDPGQCSSSIRSREAVS